MEFVIRNAQIGDAVGIGKVHAISWKETYPSLIPQDFLNKIKPEDRIPMWKKSLEDEKQRNYIWVALNQAEEVIGFCSGGSPRKPELGC